MPNLNLFRESMVDIISKNHYEPWHKWALSWNRKNRLWCNHNSICICICIFLMRPPSEMQMQMQNFLLLLYCKTVLEKNIFKRNCCPKTVLGHSSQSTKCKFKMRVQIWIWICPHMWSLWSTKYKIKSQELSLSVVVKFK